MGVKEQKFIDLKVLLSVGNLEDLSRDSKLFKKYGLVLAFEENASSSKDQTYIVSPYAKEISWLLYQLDYIFEEREDFFFDLGINLKPFMRSHFKLEEIFEFIMVKATQIS